MKKFFESAKVNRPVKNLEGMSRKNANSMARASLRNRKSLTKSFKVGDDYAHAKVATDVGILG